MAGLCPGLISKPLDRMASIHIHVQLSLPCYIQLPSEIIFQAHFNLKRLVVFFLNNNNKKLFQQENSSKLQPIQIYFPTFPNQLCCCRFVKVDDTGTSEMAAVPQVMTEFCIPALFPLSARILSNACSNALK